MRCCMCFLRCLFFMIPWLGGFVALDGVENDFHLEDAFHVAVEKRHGLPDELRLVSFLLLSFVHRFGFLLAPLRT